MPLRMLPWRSTRPNIFTLRDRTTGAYLSIASTKTTRVIIHAWTRSYGALNELFVRSEAMPILPFQGVMPKIAADVFIAPGAMIIGNVTIHEGASIWYNAVIRGDTAPIVIGRRTNIQDNCVLHVDADAPLTIGEDCTVGHG